MKLKWNDIPGKIGNIWKAIGKHSHWHMVYWRWRAINHKQYCDFDKSSLCSVMDDKCNLQCPKLKMHNRIYRNVSFLILRFKCPSTSGYASLHCESMDILCVLNISLLASSKIGDGRRISNWALKQNGRKVKLKMQYLVIWYPNENLLHL